MCEKLPFQVVLQACEAAKSIHLHQTILVSIFVIFCIYSFLVSIPDSHILGVVEFIILFSTQLIKKFLLCPMSTNFLISLLLSFFWKCLYSVSQERFLSHALYFSAIYRLHCSSISFLRINSLIILREL